MRRKSERLELVLIERKVHDLALLLPVKIYVVCVRIACHNVGDIIGERHDLLFVGAFDAQHDGVRRRRSRLDELEIRAHIREVFCKLRTNLCRQFLARPLVVRDDNELRVVFCRQNRIESQDEARRTLAHIGGIVPILPLQSIEKGGETTCLRLCIFHGRAFGKAHLNDDFRAQRRREEVLPANAQKRDGSSEDERRRAEHETAMH